MSRPSPAFVTYLRVSTDKQGRSGLGLEAQRAAVAVHVGSTGVRRRLGPISMSRGGQGL